MADETKTTELSGRERRTVDSTKVFTRYAGQQVPKEARLDKDGNPDGLEYDLGAEGVYENKEIVIIVLYDFKTYYDGFSVDKPKAALEAKGFKVTVHNKCPDADTLTKVLDGANQLWIISGRKTVLTEEQMETIKFAWEDGMGIYIMGDNDPFYADANRLAAYLGLPQMGGDYQGEKDLSVYNSGTGKGFVPHFLTTGLAKLNEGITIAHFNKTDIEKSGVEPVIYNSQGKVSVYLKPCQDGKGPIIVDGAFTKLYCHWDGTGSARFVRNCACYLGANMIPGATYDVDA